MKMQIELSVIILNLLLQMRNGLAATSSELMPVNGVVNPLIGEKIELVWMYNSSLLLDKIMFSRTNNENPLVGHIIGMWSAENGFKPDKYNLSANTRFELKKEDDGHKLIKLVLINPRSDDYNMAYYCETNDKRYSSKIVVDLERPRIETETKITSDSFVFVFNVTYPKEVVAAMFTRQIRNEHDVEEICYILFNDTSIEDKFQHRIVLNRKEIDGNQVFNVTMLNTTYRDTGEYFGYFVFQGGDHHRLTLKVSIDKKYSNKQHTAKVNPHVENTASILVSYYYTIILQCVFFLYLL